MICLKTERLLDILESYNNNYDDVTDVLLNRFDIIGDIVYVDFNELLNFKNIEKLSLVNFSLGDDLIYLLYKLNNLKSLRLINCDINFDSELFNNLKIDDLVLDNTFINFSVINRKYNLVELRNLNINCSDIRCDSLDISSSMIDIGSVNFDNIDTLVLSNSQFKNCSIFNSNYPVNITVKDDDSGEVISKYAKD